MSDKQKPSERWRTAESAGHWSNESIAKRLDAILSVLDEQHERNGVSVDVKQGGVCQKCGFNITKWTNGDTACGCVKGLNTSGASVEACEKVEVPRQDPQFMSKEEHQSYEPNNTNEQSDEVSTRKFHQKWHSYHIDGCPARLDWSDKCKCGLDDMLSKHSKTNVKGDEVGECGCPKAGHLLTCRVKPLVDKFKDTISETYRSGLDMELFARIADCHYKTLIASVIEHSKTERCECCSADKHTAPNVKKCRCEGSHMFKTLDEGIAQCQDCNGIIVPKPNDWFPTAEKQSCEVKFPAEMIFNPNEHCLNYVSGFNACIDEMKKLNAEQKKCLSVEEIEEVIHKEFFRGNQNRLMPPGLAVDIKYFATAIHNMIKGKYDVMTPLEALAIQLFLKYSDGITRPWGQLWPDEKHSWLASAKYIIDNLEDCEFYITKERPNERN